MAMVKGYSSTRRVPSPEGPEQTRQQTVLLVRQGGFPNRYFGRWEGLSGVPRWGNLSLGPRSEAIETGGLQAKPRTEDFS